MIFMRSPLLKIYYSFSYLFYGIIPYLEHSKGIYSYWGLPEASPNLLGGVNILLIILNIVVVIAYQFPYGSSYKSLQAFYHPRNFLLYLNSSLNNFKYKDNFIILITLSTISTFYVLYINDFNVYNLIFRDTSYEKIKLDGVLSQITGTFVRPIPAIVMIYYLCYQPHNYKFKIAFLIPLCLISVFPTGVPRFYAAAIYIPLIVLIYKKLLLGNRLSYFIIGSIFIIFPLLNNFRRLSDEGLQLKYDISFLFEGHFDSYLSIAQVIQLNFITYGRQLIGNLLFFIPRSLWDSKPTGTGYTLVRSLSEDSFANISANYYAEGYANFGFLGMFLFAIILGLCIRKIDEVFMIKLKFNKGADIIIPFYLLLVGFIFFLMRGDLLSSISFFLGFTACIIFCSLFFRKI